MGTRYSAYGKGIFSVLEGNIQFVGGGYLVCRKEIFNIWEINIEYV